MSSANKRLALHPGLEFAPPPKKKIAFTFVFTEKDYNLPSNVIYNLCGKFSIAFWSVAWNQSISGTNFANCRHVFGLKDAKNLSGKHVVDRI